MTPNEKEEAQKRVREMDGYQRNRGARLSVILEPFFPFGRSEQDRKERQPEYNPDLIYHKGGQQLEHFSLTVKASQFDAAATLVKALKTDGIEVRFAEEGTSGELIIIFKKEQDLDWLDNNYKRITENIEGSKAEKDEKKAAADELKKLREEMAQLRATFKVTVEDVRTLKTTVAELKGTVAELKAKLPEPPKVSTGAPKPR